MNNNRDEFNCWLVITLFAFIIAKWVITMIDLGVIYFLGVN